MQFYAAYSIKNSFSRSRLTDHIPHPLTAMIRLLLDRVSELPDLEIEDAAIDKSGAEPSMHSMQKAEHALPDECGE